MNREGVYIWRDRDVASSKARQAGSSVCVYVVCVCERDRVVVVASFESTVNFRTRVIVCNTAVIDTRDNAVGAQ